MLRVFGIGCWKGDRLIYVLIIKHLNENYTKVRMILPSRIGQARWIESLAKFSYTFKWIKGVNNTFADALSRNPSLTANNAVSVTHTLLAGLHKRLKLVANTDPDYQQLKTSATDPNTDLSIDQDLVVDTQGRIYVLKDNEIRTTTHLRDMHDSPMAGHFGMDKTLELLQRRWYWKGMQRDVREYVRTCATC